MVKKATLESLSTKIDALTGIVEKGFAAVAEGDVVRLQEQVTSIEGHLRNGRYESRLTKLESEVFGASDR